MLSLGINIIIFTIFFYIFFYNDFMNLKSNFLLGFSIPLGISRFLLKIYNSEIWCTWYNSIMVFWFFYSFYFIFLTISIISSSAISWNIFSIMQNFPFCNKCIAYMNCISVTFKKSYLFYHEKKNVSIYLEIEWNYSRMKVIFLNYFHLFI